mmetsp:Transcript_69319/g.193921  ORF Transcript_69319/g.193921 Transcript_69319/m.193921 type:complete len:249 (-) Transcript_69319:84-830(-)|eukprot:CAMPEP_0119517716 /NCGR_PEP_ID=MMETSP1344-20130328/34528_1 /TAXON_ID=236787 /ORGANISM="Florenciella parvula, Strain CCMP2471" /LENGTH=248 /DNA_ID=CAMNT_0007555333 /DNA_START=34 /DNA_END=780 /DNA_ORIENTATION=-
MPPRRGKAKAKTKATASASGGPAPKKAKSQAAAEVTPFDAHFKSLEEVVKRDDVPEGRVLGHMLIQGTNNAEEQDDTAEDYEEEDEEEEERDNASYTVEEMARLRHIIITKRRDNKMNWARRLVLGDQADDSFMMFNTSFSYEVYGAFEEMATLLKKKKDWGEKLDMLFGFTHTIKEYDVWCHDHEESPVFVMKLAKLWKSTLKQDDETLGIDSEYTRPGLLCFLNKFKEMVEEIPEYDDGPMSFNFE